MDGGDRVTQRLVEPADERRHADDRRDADHDAKHGEAGPHLVVADRIERHADDFVEETCADGHLFAPQGFDGVELRGLHRGIQTEEQPDERRDADAQDDRPELDPIEALRRE